LINVVNEIKGNMNNHDIEVNIVFSYCNLFFILP